MTAHCSLRPESETKRPCNPGDEGRGGRPEGDGTGADAMSSGCATGPGSVAVSLPPNAPSPRSTTSPASRQDGAAGARGTAGTPAGAAMPEGPRVGARFATKAVLPAGSGESGSAPGRERGGR